MQFNKVYKKDSNYSIPDSCKIIAVYIDGNEIEEYEVIDNTISISEEIDFGILTAHLISSKTKIVGYSYRDSVFKFFSGEDETLESSSKYEISLSPENISIDVNTQFTPMYCKVKDVNNLIKPVIDYLIDKPDIEYEIFLSSNDYLNELFDEDTDWEEVSMRNLGKLVANKVAHTLIYKYFYQTLPQIGEFEERIGTLSEVANREILNLDLLLKRFEDEIERLEESFNERVYAVSFTKASDSSTGLNDRLWDTSS